MSLTPLGAVGCQFSYEALLNAYWLDSFQDVVSQFGKGKACENSDETVLTYYDGQLPDLETALKNFATTTGMSYVFFGQDGTGNSNTDMIIYELAGDLKSTCDEMSSRDTNYRCDLPDYCGANAPSDSLSPAGNSGSSSSAAGSNSGSGSGSASASGSPSASASGSGSSSGSASASGSPSASASGSGSGSASASGSPSASASGSGSGSGSASASSAASSALGSASGPEYQWSGYSVNGSTNTATENVIVSTKLITVTSCSENSCTENVHSTVITMATSEPFSSTPKTSEPNSSTASVSSKALTTASTFATMSSSSTASFKTQTENAAGKQDYSLGTYLLGAALLLL